MPEMATEFGYRHLDWWLYRQIAESGATTIPAAPSASGSPQHAYGSAVLPIWYSWALANSPGEIGRGTRRENGLIEEHPGRTEGHCIEWANAEEELSNRSGPREGLIVPRLQQLWTTRRFAIVGLSKKRCLDHHHKQDT